MRFFKNKTKTFDITIVVTLTLVYYTRFSEIFRSGFYIDFAKFLINESISVFMGTSSDHVLNLLRIAHIRSILALYIIIALTMLLSPTFTPSRLIKKFSLKLVKNVKISYLKFLLFRLSKNRLQNIIMTIVTIICFPYFVLIGSVYIPYFLLFVWLPMKLLSLLEPTEESKI